MMYFYNITGQLVQEQQLPHPDLQSIINERQKEITVERRTLIKLLKERLLRSVPVLQENAEYVGLLLPTVQRLLVLLLSLEDEHVDDLRIGHEAVLLKQLADASAYFRHRHVQCEGSAYLGSLNMSMTKKKKSQTTKMAAKQSLFNYLDGRTW